MKPPVLAHCERMLTIITVHGYLHVRQTFGPRLFPLIDSYAELSITFALRRKRLGQAMAVSLEHNRIEAVSHTSCLAESC